MAPDYRMYLAENVVNEQRTVSYRTLSRAMGVHVNQAKRMLYDFYDRENSKKKGSVHAMYLLAGKKKLSSPSLLNGHAQSNGHAEANPSSPVMSSSMPEAEDTVIEIPTRTITLVREEDLDEVKASYDSISTIHVYSLEPGRIEDLQTLADVGREIFANTFVKEDPLEHYKKYGIIQNKYVKRRTGVKPPLPPAPASSEKTSTTKPSSAAPSVTKAQPSTTANAGPFAKASAASLKRTDSQDSNHSASPATSTTKPPSLKRDASSIFQSFAKARPKAEKKDEDTTMKDTAPFGNDDNEEGADEEEEDAMFLDTGTRTSTKAKEEREERARKLRKMMEDSDAEDDTVQEDLIPLDQKQGAVTTQTTTKTKRNNKPSTNTDNTEHQPKKEDENEANEAEWPSSPGPPTAAAAAQNPDPETAAEAPSRRRGRRKVIKKRTMKDEEGYLVTKEEAVWESFSEEDEPEKENKSKPLGKPKTLGTGGSAKAGGKGGKGGGNIMSFFSKK